LHFHQPKKRANKEGMLWLWKERELCGRLSNEQAHTQGQEEEGMQG
jgi:hypothetical protein